MTAIEQVLADARMLYDFHTFDSGPQRADVILALGSHDLRVADRAAEVVLGAEAPLLVCTGASGKVTTGLFGASTEAEVYASRCRDLGVAEEQILIEKESSNTGENFTLSRTLLERRGQQVETGIIVCKPYMAKRAWATAMKQWPLREWYLRPPEIRFEDYPSEETPRDRMINLMVGDLQRLWVFAERGFQVPVEVPPPILAAWHRLRSAGFDQFLVA